MQCPSVPVVQCCCRLVRRVLAEVVQWFSAQGLLLEVKPGQLALWWALVTPGLEALWLFVLVTHLLPLVQGALCQSLQAWACREVWVGLWYCKAAPASAQGQDPCCCQPPMRRRLDPVAGSHLCLGRPSLGTLAQCLCRQGLPRGDVQGPLVLLLGPAIQARAVAWSCRLALWLGVRALEGL